MPIGRIVGPFGVRGEAKIELHTDFPERFRSLKRVFVGPSHSAMEVERSRRHKGQVLLKLAGVDRPEDVESLREQDVMVPRSEAVTLPEGHFFLSDLLGIEVFTPDGASLGTITDVLRTGSNDVWVVSEGRQELLLPAIKDAVIDLDLPARRAVVERWAADGGGGSAGRERAAR
jgi:16S rRNA processing protein RimM